MSLSPRPSKNATQSLATAIRELGSALGEDDQELVARLGATAAALVERYAPSAPAPIKCEAVIRCAGWLRESPAAGVRSESEGEISTSFTPSATSALRASGAMGLLTNFKIRRAGVVA